MVDIFFATLVFGVVILAIVACALEIYNKPSCPKCGASGNSTYRWTAYWVEEDWGCGHCGWSWKEDDNND